MANRKQETGFFYWVKKLWNNYVVRNIVLAVIFIVLLAGIASLLLNIFTRHNKYKDVPDFVGISLEDAESLAKTDRLRIEINDSLYVPTYAPGVILEQKPEAGTQVKSGRRIFVTVNSARQKMVTVPYVAGYSLRQAKNMLETAGLTIERLIYVEDIATNNVLEQKVSGTKVVKNRPFQAEMGSGVTLTVGRARDASPVTVPKVTGMPLHQAQSRIFESGLNIGRIIYDNDINSLNQKNARVYSQTPAPGRYQPLGTEVTLRLTVDSAKLVRGMNEAEEASRGNQRQRILTDSLVRAGYPSDLIDEEVDYILRRERGELTEADSTRSIEEFLRVLDIIED